MKINKFTLIGYIFGALVVILSIWQYWFVFYDPSQVVLYVALGVFIIAFAYVYQSLIDKDKKIDEIIKDIQAIDFEFNQFISWKNKNEKEE